MGICVVFADYEREKRLANQVIRMEQFCVTMAPGCAIFSTEHHCTGLSNPRKLFYLVSVETHGMHGLIDAAL